jgi:hypothetical protein
LLSWLTNAEVRNQAAKEQGPTKRLRDVLDAMRSSGGSLEPVVGLDVRAGFVPMGMVIQRTNGTAPVVIPASVRRVYPIVLAMDGGARCVLIRAWSVAGWSMTIATCVVFAPVGFVHARRLVWVRAGRCVWCGYSLVGIAEDARCPECGEGR